ncbi:MAG: hypothetical protein GEU78_16255 [Actinobacteria bacterium]|nr:hypothetical protein [Actinomycetota bacterium]
MLKLARSSDGRPLWLVRPAHVGGNGHRVVHLDAYGDRSQSLCGLPGPWKRTVPAMWQRCPRCEARLVIIRATSHRKAAA